MHARGGAARLALAVATVVLLTGCATARIESGVFHSSHGYRVTLPGPDWEVAGDGRAELELRHRGSRAGIATNAVCEPAVARRSPGVLTRHLLVGLRERVVVETGEAAVNGRQATRTVVEGRPAAGADPVRVEAYVLKDDRCVYDFLYVAPPGAFAATRADFGRLVESFTTE